MKTKWRVVEVLQKRRQGTSNYSHEYTYYVEFRFLWHWERWATPYNSPVDAQVAIDNHIRMRNPMRVVYTCES